MQLCQRPSEKSLDKIHLITTVEKKKIKKSSKKIKQGGFIASEFCLIQKKNQSEPIKYSDTLRIRSNVLS